jgi:hypothetical protein
VVGRRRIRFGDPEAAITVPVFLEHLDVFSECLCMFGRVAGQGIHGNAMRAADQGFTVVRQDHRITVDHVKQKN